MVDFSGIVDTLQDWGFYDIVLPFILVYVVVFAILEKSGIFKGKDSDASQLRSVHAVIAFVFALFAVASIQTIQTIQSLIVNIVLVVIFILVVLILLAFVFGEDYMQLFMDKDGDGWKIKKWAAWVLGLGILLLSVLILAWILGFWDWMMDFIDGFGDSDDFWTVVFLIALGGVLYWVSKGDSRSAEHH